MVGKTRRAGDQTIWGEYVQGMQDNPLGPFMTALTSLCFFFLFFFSFLVEFIHPLSSTMLVGKVAQQLLSDSM